jgi:predicted DCC family thiol-disulfide oxidoreductase YuxK
VTTISENRGLAPPLERFKAAPKASLTVYFDEGCGPCTRLALMLDKLNWFGRVRYQPACDHPTARGAQYGDILSTRADGRAYVGYDTYPQICWRTPLLWLVAPFLYLPPISWVGRRIYRRIADSRECEVEADS